MNRYYTDISPAPTPSVGVSFRQPWLLDLLHVSDGLPSALEVIADHFLLPTRQTLRSLELLQGRFPLLPHSLGLSLAGPEGAGATYLRQVAGFARRVNAPWVSDHVAVTQAHGRAIGHLAPPVYDAAHLDILCFNVEHSQRKLPAPLVLEPIAYGFVLPDAQMSEAAFLSQLVSRTGVGLLLDVANVWINAANLAQATGQEPEALIAEYLGNLPLEAVIQLHLAGGHQHGKRHIDSHSAPVPEAVWDLLSRILALCPNVQSVVLERDDNLPPFADIKAELARVWAALDARPQAAARGQTPPLAPINDASVSHTQSKQLADARERQHLVVKLYTEERFRVAVQADAKAAVHRQGFSHEAERWALRLPWDDVGYFADSLLHKRFEEALTHLPRLAAMQFPIDLDLRQAFVAWAANRPVQGLHKPAEDAWRFAKHLRRTAFRDHTALAATAALDGLGARLACGRPFVGLALLARGEAMLGLRFGTWRYMRRLR